MSLCDTPKPAFSDELSRAYPSELSGSTQRGPQCVKDTWRSNPNRSCPWNTQWSRPILVASASVDVRSPLHRRPAVTRVGAGKCGHLACPRSCARTCNAVRAQPSAVRRSVTSGVLAACVLEQARLVRWAWQQRSWQPIPWERRHAHAHPDAVDHAPGRAPWGRFTDTTHEDTLTS